MCAHPPKPNPLIPATTRWVARTYLCWMPAHHELGILFAQRSQEPTVLGRRVAAPEVHAVFQEYHGVNWQKYWRAWKGNFGYGAVADNGLPTSTAFYNANLTWCFDMYQLGQFWNPADGVPPGCNCKLCGGYPCGGAT